MVVVVVLVVVENGIVRLCFVGRKAAVATALLDEGRNCKSDSMAVAR